MRITVELNWPRPRQWPRRRWAAILAVVALILPSGAFAAHNFTDVPTSHTFHGDIADAYAARLTAGCSPTTFCPDATVTRGQMTAFLNRGLGRLAQGNLSGTLLTTGASATLGTVTIRAGNVPGGTALVYLYANVNVYAATAGCPCEMRMDIRDPSGNPIGSYVLADLPAIPAGDNDTDTMAVVQGMFVVPTGVDQVFSVLAIRTLGTANLLPYGKLTAIYIPFDGAGNPAGAAAGARDEADPRD
jgi:hypothetical protein